MPYAFLKGDAWSSSVSQAAPHMLPCVHGIPCGKPTEVARVLHVQKDPVFYNDGIFIIVPEDQRCF